MASTVHENFAGHVHYTAQSTSPTPLTASMGSPDINSLFEAFTNNGSYQSPDEYGLFAMQQQQHMSSFPNQPSYSAQQGYMQEETHFQEEPLRQSSSPSYLGYHGSEALQFTDGLRIHPAHYQQPIPAASYYTERPSAKTVLNLEAAVMDQAGPIPYFRQSQASLPGRQSRRSTLSDGVSQIASMSLNSPRHSVSTGSTTSSSQNSPTTPISAFSIDSSASMQQQQQQQQYYAYKQVPDHLGQSTGAGQMNPQYAQSYHYQQTMNSLSASLPPSFSQQGTAIPMQLSASQQQVPSANGIHRSKTSDHLSQSQTRASSSGLMERIVSRKTTAPFFESEEVHVPTEAVPTTEKKGGRSRTRSKSGLGTSPPLTPSRAALRSSRSAATPQSTSQVPASSTDEQQNASMAGPQRTPSKASATPKRPATLRRTASHTPNSSTPAMSGLASPAQVNSFRMQQTMSGNPDTATLRRVGSGLALDFSARPAAMARAISSPGWAIPQPPPSRGSDSESVQSSSHSRRSSTALSLQMSPVSGHPNTTFPPLASPISASLSSCQQALQALSFLSDFLAEQAVSLQSNPSQSAASALGTYEQNHAIEELKRRVQQRLSGQM